MRYVATLLHPRRRGLGRRLERRARGVADRSLAAARVVDPVLTLVAFRRGHGRWPALRHPRTFSDKLARKRLLDRRPYLTRTTDKVAVRAHVAARVGTGVLPALLDVVDAAERLDFARYPRAFVVKPSHRSGRVRVVADRDTADLDEVRAAAGEWLRGQHPLYYRGIPPRLLVEEFLGDPAGGPAADHKLLVVHGRVEQIGVHVDRFGDHRVSLYDARWRRLPVTYGSPPGPDLPAPPNLARMVALAELLAEGTDVVRVDLYDLGDRVVFGELTHSPGGAALAFDPPGWDDALGARWHPPRSYGRDRALAQG